MVRHGTPAIMPAPSKPGKLRTLADIGGNQGESEMMSHYSGGSSGFQVFAPLGKSLPRPPEPAASLQ